MAIPSHPQMHENPTESVFVVFAVFGKLRSQREKATACLLTIHLVYGDKWTVASLKVTTYPCLQSGLN